MTSPQPGLNSRHQIGENVVRHLGVPWRAARERSRREMLDLVRIAMHGGGFDNIHTSFRRHASARHDPHGAVLAIRRLMIARRAGEGRFPMSPSQAPILDYHAELEEQKNGPPAIVLIRH